MLRSTEEEKSSKRVKFDLKKNEEHFLVKKSKKDSFNKQKNTKNRIHSNKENNKNKNFSKKKLIPRNTPLNLTNIQIPSQYAPYTQKCTIPDYITLMSILYLESRISKDKNQNPLVYINEMVKFVLLQRVDHFFSCICNLVEMMIDGYLIESVDEFNEKVFQKDTNQENHKKEIDTFNKEQKEKNTHSAKKEKKTGTINQTHSDNVPHKNTTNPYMNTILNFFHSAFTNKHINQKALSFSLPLLQINKESVFLLKLKKLILNLITDKKGTQIIMYFLTQNRHQLDIHNHTSILLLKMFIFNNNFLIKQRICKLFFNLNLYKPILLKYMNDLQLYLQLKKSKLFQFKFIELKKKEMDHIEEIHRILFKWEENEEKSILKENEKILTDLLNDGENKNSKDKNNINHKSEKINSVQKNSPSDFNLPIKPVKHLLPHILKQSNKNLLIEYLKKQETITIDDLNLMKIHKMLNSKEIKKIIMKKINTYYVMKEMEECVDSVYWKSIYRRML